MAKNSEYTAKEIQVLEGLEPVRKRPGMYIGSTESRGLHEMVRDIIDNSVDESFAGVAKNVWVHISQNGEATVRDDGRGIPVDKHKSGVSALEVTMTKLHAGGKFGGGAYKVSGGLHGVGASVVNALSSYFRVIVLRDGNSYFQEYKKGEPLKPVAEATQTQLDSWLPKRLSIQMGDSVTGTITTFTPTMLKQFSPNDFPYLSLIIVTGENLFYEDMQPWLTAGVAIINGYGPTEIGVGLTMGQFKKIDNKNNIPISHIGQPIPNTYVYIIDDNNQIAPVGAYGQIAVGGVGLTPGYLNLPALTDLSFKKIYLNDEEITVYLTGDKGKFNAEGYLEISGRINANNQVKINGVRLELDNVKINLCKHPQIVATEVLVTNTSNGDKCIACYIVPKNTDEVKFSAKELTALLLKQGFPPQALPLSYYIIDAVPMTTNGKVDTQTLISKYSKSSLPSLQYIKPETDIQFRLAAIFREVLAISANKQVSINDHFFFDLGGSSLLASKLRHRIREEYGYDAFPSLSSFFSEPTIEYLANHIQSNRYDLINAASFTVK